jgi:hypothetical protein
MFESQLARPSAEVAIAQPHIIGRRAVRHKIGEAITAGYNGNWNGLTTESI